MKDSMNSTSIPSFKDFPLAPQILENLAQVGIENPTQIQIKALEHLLADVKVDFHGQAQTGTGKTLAFGLPLFQSIDRTVRPPQALIVAPTRELVVQICDSLRAVAKGLGIIIEPVYGGVSIEQQLRVLRKGVHIVVGTPGRLNDHLRRKSLAIAHLKTLVLDEADIMLDMGFKEEIDEILTYASKDRQIWLFSATVKPGIRDLKERHMKDPITVKVAAKALTVASTKQYYCVVPRRLRLGALVRFIEGAAQDFYGVIFCQTKILADEVAQSLNDFGYGVKALHGDMSQAVRNKAIKEFKEKRFTILVATDVAARGLDIANLTHVVNYCLPEDQESYVHRIGRTGRAGKEGVAITLVNPSELRRLQQMATRFQADIIQLTIPDCTSITQQRLEKAAANLDALLAKPVDKHACSQQLYALLQQRSPQDLVNGLYHMLSQSVLNSCAQQQELEKASFNSERSSSSSYDRGGDRGDRGGYRGRRDYGNRDGNQQEIMFNVGLDDGITKQDLLAHVQLAQSLKGERVGRVHVINRRSFVTVPPHIAQPLQRELNGKPLQGKQVRVTMSS